MDKDQLNLLLSQGKISKATYDTAMAKAGFDSTPDMSAQPAPVMPNPVRPMPGPVMTPQPQPVVPQPVVPQPVVPQPAPVEPMESEPTFDLLPPKTSTTVTSAIKSPEAKKAENDYIKSLEDQKKAQEAIAKTAQAKAAEEFALTQEREKLNAEAMVKRQALADQAVADHEARLAKIDSDVEALKGAKYEGFWAKKDTGTKIMGAIAVAMGAYASSVGGGPNYALNIIQKATDDDFNQFKQGIDQQIAAIQQSRLSIENKERLTKQKLDALDAYSLAQNEQVKNKISALGSKFAGSDAQNKLQELTAKIDENASQKRLDLADRYKTSVATTIASGEVKARERKPSPGIKAGDEDFAKDYNKFIAGGRNNAANAIAKMEKLATEMEKDKGLIETGGGGRFSAILPDVVRSRDSIRRRDEARNYANVTLKEIFGGQLSDDERKAAAQEYYNDKLDNPENAKILRQKIKELKDNLNSKDAQAKYFEKNGTLEGFQGMDNTVKNTIRVTNGVKVLEIDPADEAEAAASGYKRAN